MIICLLIPLSTVSASDINNTADDQVLSATPSVDTLSASVNPENNNDTLSVNDENILSAGSDSGSDNLLSDDGENETEKVGSYSDLYDLYKLSSDNLTLYGDFKYNSSTDSAYITGIPIDKTITIDGNQHTIDGSQIAQLFRVTADNVIIKNINVINTYTTNSDYASILWLGSNGQVIKSNFTNTRNTASNNIDLDYEYSGCIKWMGDDGKITDCRFENNYAVNAYNSASAVLCSSKNLNVSNTLFYKTSGTISFTATMSALSPVLNYCNFTSCNGGYGTVFSRRAQLELNHCNFTSNRASFVIFNRGISYLNYCYFTKNTANQIADGTIRAYKCNFTSNTLSNSIFNPDFDGDAYSFINCSFINEARQFTSNSKIGGKIINCTFDNVGRASNNIIGGAPTLLTIENCSFTNCFNSNQKYGLLRFQNGDKYTLNNLTFTNCQNLKIVFGNTDIHVNYDDITAQYLNIPNPSFISYDKLYVESGANGSGMINDPCNLTFAFENLDYGGIMHVKGGIYNEWDKNVHYDLYGSLIGYGGKVLTNNLTLSLVNIGGSVENIIFNNTTLNFGILTNNKFNNVTISNSNYSDGNILQYDYASGAKNFNMIDCKLDNVTFDSLLGASNFVTANIYNLTIHNCTFEKLLYLENLNYNDFTNISITNSTFDKFLEAFKPNYYKAFTMNNVSLVGNTINDVVMSVDNDDYGYARINNLTFKDNMCNSSLDYLFNLKYNSKFNLLTIDNISSIDNSSFNNIIMFGNVGNSIEVSEFIKFNATKLVNASFIYGFNNINITSVTLENNLTTFAGMGMDNIKIKHSNFTNNLIFVLDGGFLSNSEFDDYKGHIVVIGDKVVFTKNKFINGNNPTLNGSAIEVVNGNYITFENCSFIENNGLNGAVYLVNGSLRPAFMDCVFTDNYAQEKAGAIYFKYNPGEGIVVTFGGITEDSIPLRNGEKENGVFGNLTEAVSIVYVINDTGSRSGAQANAKTPETSGTFDTAYAIAGKNCIFVFVRSGDVFNYTNSPLKGQLMESLDDGWTFKGNDTTIENLRFYITKGNLKAYNVTFSGNDAGSVVIIDDENVLFDNCSFINNGGDKISYGGAIQINANNTNITNCTFINNTAQNETGGYGGALYINASNVVISNNTFDHNSAVMDGSHIYIDENHENIAINGTNTFKNGYRTGSGFNSGVVIQGDNINVVENIFDNNTGYIGSALSLIGIVNNININNNLFKNNIANDKGTVYLSYTNGLDTQINVNDNTFDNNTASTDGGALYVDKLNRPDLLSFANNNYSNNTAVNGGAVYINVEGIAFNGGELSGNNASNGGAVYINGDNAVLNDLIFTNNTAVNGGALYVNASGAKIVDCDFTYNKATNGSAIYIAKGADLTFNKINVDYNEVVNHETGFGDIYPASGSSFYIPTSSDLTLGENPYQQFIYDGTDFLIGDIYISQIGNGNGLSDKSPADLDFALKRIAPNGRIHIIEDVEYVKTNLNNLTNVTIVSTGHTIKRQGTDKYLFIHLKL